MADVTEEMVQAGINAAWFPAGVPPETKRRRVKEAYMAMEAARATPDKQTITLALELVADKLVAQLNVLKGDLAIAEGALERANGLVNAMCRHD